MDEQTPFKPKEKNQPKQIDETVEINKKRGKYTQTIKTNG